MSISALSPLIRLATNIFVSGTSKLLGPKVNSVSSLVSANKVLVCYSTNKKVTIVVSFSRNSKLADLYN